MIDNLLFRAVRYLYFLSITLWFQFFYKDSLTILVLINHNKKSAQVRDMRVEKLVILCPPKGKGAIFCHHEMSFFFFVCHCWYIIPKGLLFAVLLAFARVVVVEMYPDMTPWCAIQCRDLSDFLPLSLYC